MYGKTPTHRYTRSVLGQRGMPSESGPEASTLLSRICASAGLSCTTSSKQAADSTVKHNGRSRHTSQSVQVHQHRSTYLAGDGLVELVRGQMLTKNPEKRIQSRLIINMLFIHKPMKPSLLTLG